MTRSRGNSSVALGPSARTSIADVASVTTTAVLKAFEIDVLNAGMDGARLQERARKIVAPAEQGIHCTVAPIRRDG